MDGRQLTAALPVMQNPAPRTHITITVHRMLSQQRPHEPDCPVLVGPLAGSAMHQLPSRSASFAIRPRRCVTFCERQPRATLPRRARHLAVAS